MKNEAFRAFIKSEFSLGAVVWVKLNGKKIKRFIYMVCKDNNDIWYVLSRHLGYCDLESIQVKEGHLFKQRKDAVIEISEYQNNKHQIV